MSHRIITLVRHGKVDAPAALYGHTDVNLSAEGAGDMQRVFQRIHHENPVTHVLGSPLVRCAQPAQLLAQAHQLPLQIVQGLKEMHFGDWDGIPFEQFTDADWNSLHDFWNTPATAHAPGGEFLEAFAQRVINAWQAIQNNGDAKHQLVVCHGGVIRIIIAHLLNLDWRNPGLFRQLTIDYASCTRIEIPEHPDAQAVIKYIGASIR